MNLCSSGHTEVCYTDNYCPVCDLIADYEAKLANGEDEREQLQQIIDIERNDKILHALSCEQCPNPEEGEDS